MNVGESIAAYRREAGMSQAELARAVLVSRQTVSNWETGKTLPDAESVARLAEAFGTSTDELLDARGAESRAHAVAARHSIVVNMAKCLVCIALYLVLHLGGMGAEDAVRRGALDGSWQGIGGTCAVLALTVMLWGLRYSARIERTIRDLGLERPVEVVAFMEGRDPRGGVPADFMYRVVVPHWRWFYLVVCGLLVTMLTAPMLFG